jgi:uncharacterized protein
MNKLISKNIVAICCFFALPIFSFSQIDYKDLPPRPSPPRLVNDLANILSEGQEADLEIKLDNYNDSTSTQIAVVIINSTGQYDIADYATYLGRKWEVGEKDFNNGVVLLVAVNDHNVFIASGYGAEPYLTDAHSKRIVENDLIPNFKNSNYYQGINLATDDIIKYLSGQFVAGAEEPAQGSDTWIAIIVFILIMLFVFRRFGGGGGGTTFAGGGTTYWGRGFGGGFGGGGGGGGGFGGFGGGSFGGGGSGGSW